MPLNIALVLAILAVALLLFVTEKLRADLVALLVLGSLALTGLVTPTQALSGFSNPAVVTVWAVFILSGALYRTGVANLIGRQVLRLAGQNEAQLLAVIMLTAGGMSAFMNNVGVAALLLPVVMDIARQTNRAPSKLLMPLAFGSLLGGLTTLIGTPPNILVSNALRASGLPAFGLFDYTPVGLAVMLGGVAFMVLIGRHLLPEKDIAKETATAPPAQPGLFHNLTERLFVVRLPADSALVGKTLANSRLRSALGLNVIGIIKNNHTQLSPPPHTLLKPGDKLLVEGKTEQLANLRGRRLLLPNNLPANPEVSREIEVAEVSLSPRSALLGQTLAQINFRRRFGLNALAIRRQGRLHRANLPSIPLQAGDTLLVQGPRLRLHQLRETADFLVSEAEAAEVYPLHERLIVVHVPPDSALAGKTLADTHLGDAFDLTVLGIIRRGDTLLVPPPATTLLAGDTLLIEGNPADLTALTGLQDLEIDRETPLAMEDLQSEQVGLIEVVLSPYTALAGKTLRQLRFRERYGLSVLAIWRQGQVCRTNLPEVNLELGDALLLYGPREKFKILGQEPDFLVLTEAAQEVMQVRKAPLAALVLGAVLLVVVLGWLPIAVAAVLGATIMVLAGCLTMEEAYRFIEWKAVFLIAGMLPLGIAMQNSGAAQFLANGLIALVGGWGVGAMLAGLFILTTLAAQVMPTAAVAVLMAPIALTTARDLQVSPYALSMIVAVSASASFLSPIAHPANILTMGPGGYRFTDYLRVGIPLTIVVLVITLLVLPIFWPVYP
ncbi:MAG: SLC13 family permease [Anaerolineae bacterium]|nr:SLC13 family permease [Anaerolineae bacterium]